MQNDYDFGSTFNLLENDLLTDSVLSSAQCKCSCHTLFGLDEEHSQICCPFMLDDYEK